jgi:hypothetical protein
MEKIRTSEGKEFDANNNGLQKAINSLRHKKIIAIVSVICLIAVSVIVSYGIGYDIGFNDSSNIGYLIPHENETVLLFKEEGKYYAVHRYDYDAHSEWMENQKNMYYQDENGDTIVNTTLYIGNLYSPTTIDGNAIRHFHWNHYFGGFYGKTFIGRGG